MAGSLDGFFVGITADRRAEEQAQLLERRGARVIHGPCIRTLPLDAEDGLREATRELSLRPPDYLVANTGIGIRSWLSAAASWGLEERLLAGLARARVVARGPKAGGAVASAALEVWWQAPSERLREVGERLLEEPLTGRRVAVQLSGDDRQDLTSVLRQAGAEVVEVPVYRWTLPDDRAPARRLIQAICAGRVDCVTFTTAPTVRNLMLLAADDGLAADVRAAFGELPAACVGPVCAEAARAEGLRVVLEPPRARLGSMVRLLGDHLEATVRGLWLGDVAIRLQGSLVEVEGERAYLTDQERAVLRALLARPGAVVERSRLRRELWGREGGERAERGGRTSERGGEHGVDVAVSRLRRKLGPAGAAVQTVVRRGYRLDAVVAEAPPPRLTAGSQAV